MADDQITEAEAVNAFERANELPPSPVKDLAQTAALALEYAIKVESGADLHWADVPTLVAHCTVLAADLYELAKLAGEGDVFPHSSAQPGGGGSAPASLFRVLRLHAPRSELMVDEEATIDDVSADDATVEVLVCDHCFHLAHPDGLDDYCDPDVYWPCPTAKAASGDYSLAPVFVKEGGVTGEINEEENLQPGVSINTDQLRLRKRWLYPIPRGRCESIFMMIDKLCDEIDALRNDRDKWHDNALAAATGRDRHA